MAGRIDAGLFPKEAAAAAQVDFIVFVSTGRHIGTSVCTLSHTETVDVEVREGDAGKDALLDAASGTLFILLDQHQCAVVFFYERPISANFV